jgi:hypothetical protein
MSASREMYVRRPKVKRKEGFDDGAIVKLKFDELSDLQKTNFTSHRIPENSLGVIMNYEPYQPDSTARGNIPSNVYYVLWKGKSYIGAKRIPMKADQIRKVGQISDDDYRELIISDLNISEIIDKYSGKLQDLPDEPSLLDDEPSLLDDELSPPLHVLGGGKRARKSRKSRKVRKSRKSRKARKSRKSRRRARR